MGSAAQRGRVSRGGQAVASCKLGGLREGPAQTLTPCQPPLEAGSRHSPSPLHPEALQGLTKPHVWTPGGPLYLEPTRGHHLERLQPGFKQRLPIRV